MRKIFKKENGITLIALIITIIVLLILSGISIATLAGDNGVLKQARESTVKSKEAQIKEEIRLAYNAMQIADYEKEWGTDKRAEELEKELKKIDTLAAVGVNGTDLKIVYKGYETTISERGMMGELTKGDGVTMLNGDGQTYYTLAPSTLSFRSSANIGDFQEVQINGETIDSSNYTMSEGSTIINLSIDYLKTLAEDDYSISIVSKTGSPSAGFSVIEPDVNEHGFYYGQPYYAYIEDMSSGYAFMMYEDGTADIFLINISMEVMKCQYSIEDKVITLHTEAGDIVCNLSDDNKSIYCEYINATLTVGNSEIAADEEYLYKYNEFYDGYVARAIDKSKQYYKPIKSNIYGIDVVSLSGAFADCVNMIKSPKIPDSVKDLDSTYANCESLIETPEIPENVEAMISAFSGCTSLTKAPVIPSKVIDLSSAFYRCYNLTGIIEINASKIKSENINAYSDCFAATKLPIKIVGSCSEEMKAIFASTAENGNVTY